MDIASVIFLLLLLSALFVMYRRIRFLRSVIGQGKATPTPLPSFWTRIGHVLHMIFWQKRMFTHPWVGLLHAVIYIGFLLINLVVLEVILDGILGKHRLLASVLGSFWYGMGVSILEALAVGVMVSCGVFLWRRNSGKVKRLRSKELKGFPLWDAHMILIFEILLVGAFLKLNAVDQVLQDRGVYAFSGNFVISGVLLKFFFEGWGTSFLVFVERLYWWFHIAGIFFFACYLTYSKHLHIVFAFINAYYRRKGSSGSMPRVLLVESTVKAMLEGKDPPAMEESRLGARDVEDLTQKQILESLSCTECGRCTAVCPAHLSGQRLSPRRIMMMVRDRAEEQVQGQQKERFLYGHYIQTEEINACTTCQACVWACPIHIDPLSVILSLRQYQAMETDASPRPWQEMFNHIEKQGSPWGLDSSTREDWRKKA